MKRELTPDETYARAERFIEAAKASTENRDVKYRLEDEVRLTKAGYAEPGYTDPASGVIAFANWNKVTRYDKEQNKSVTVDDTMSRLCDLYEKLGVAIEWSDEWTFCSKCAKAVRTNADSYGWKRSYVEDRERLRKITCCECVESNKDAAAEVLRSLEGEATKALTLNVDPEDHGYKLLDEQFENGFYGGQSADPRKIGAALTEQGITRWLFRIDDVGQFDLKFCVFIHEEEFDKLDLSALKRKADGPDPAEQLSKALKSTPVVVGKITGEGVQITEVNSVDGTSTVREVSREDLIAGKAFKK